MSKQIQMIIFVAMSAVFLHSANATITQYDYSAPVTIEIRNGQLATAEQSLFSTGDIISGGFTYNTDAISFPGDPNGTIYLAIANLFGSIGGNSYSDPAGGIALFNDSFDINPIDPSNPLIDFATIVADAGDGVTDNLSGFSIENGGTTFQLVNVRLFWFDQVNDFLDDELLTENLPPSLTSVARIALDFVDSNDSTSFHTVFGDPLTVTAVPVPAAIWLFMGGVGALFSMRSRRKH